MKGLQEWRDPFFNFLKESRGSVLDQLKTGNLSFGDATV